MRSLPTGFPLPFNAFAGGSRLTRGGSPDDDLSLEDLLNNLAQWANDQVQFPFGSHVLTVAPVGGGARFESITDALAYADTLAGPVGILLAPHEYDEDVILRRDNVHFNGLAGGLGGIIVKSMTVSDCTLASIANFSNPLHADKGDPTKLVRDTSLASIPRTMSFTNIRFARRTNVPAWFSGTDGVWDPSTSKYCHDSALYSFRALGAPVAGTTFLEDVCAFVNCVTDTAVGSIPNAPNGFYFCFAGNPVFLNSLTGDGVQAHNCGGVLLLNSLGFSPVVAFSDSAEPMPSVGYTSGFAVLGGTFMAGMYAIGAEGVCPFVMAATINAEFKTEATVAASTFMANSCVNGNIEITNVGPGIAFFLGRYVAGVGAGIGGLAVTVGLGT